MIEGGPQKDPVGCWAHGLFGNGDASKKDNLVNTRYNGYFQKQIKIAVAALTINLENITKP